MQCRTHDGQPSDQCLSSERPVDARRCDTACEEESPQIEGNINKNILLNLKARYSSKIDILLSKKSLIRPKMIYGINTNIKCGP